MQHIPPRPPPPPEIVWTVHLLCGQSMGREWVYVCVCVYWNHQKPYVLSKYISSIRNQPINQSINQSINDGNGCSNSFRHFNWSKIFESINNTTLPPRSYDLSEFREKKITSLAGDPSTALHFLCARGSAVKIQSMCTTHVHRLIESTFGRQSSAKHLHCSLTA